MFRFFFHFIEPGIVVSKFVQVCQGNFPGHEGIIISYIRKFILLPVLQFHIHPHAELLHVKSAPVNPELLPYLLCFFGSEYFFDTHACLLSRIIILEKNVFGMMS